MTGRAKRVTVARMTVALLLLGGVLGPLIPLFVWAVAGQWRYPHLLPQRLTMRGLAHLADPRTQVLTGLATSTLIATAVAVLACLIGLPAGRAIGWHDFPGRRVVQFALLAPVIVPGLAATMGIQVYFTRFGLADTIAGVILVHLVPTVPYAATLLGAAYANLDPGYEHQARALGASPIRAFGVTVVLLRPAIATAALFAFLISWSEYVLTLLIGGGQVKTLPLLLFSAIGTADTTTAAALAMLVIIPPLLAVAVTARLTGRGSAASIGFGRL